MRAFATLALLVVPCLFPQTTLRPEELCSIEGKITNEVTGLPIRKALVVVTSGPATGPAAPPAPRATGGVATPGSYAVETDAEGRYRVAELLPGSYRLASQKTGFMIAAFGSGEPIYSNMAAAGAAASRPLELTTGQKATGIDLKLQPYGAIAGRVLDTDGEALWHAQVGVYRWGYSIAGVRGLQRFADGDTDENGDYRLFQIPPGRYSVCAYGPGQPGGLQRAAQPPRESYVTTCYAGSDIAEGATAIVVQPGQTASAANFKMIKRPAATVGGRLTNPSPGMQRGNIRLYSISNPLVGIRYPGVGPKGEFEIDGVPAGEYRLVATAGDQTAQVDIQVTDRAVETNLALGGGVVVSGNLQVEGGVELGSPITVNMYDPEIGTTWAGSRIQGAGDFQLRQVYPWQLQLRFGMPAGFYIKSARMGARDVLVDGLDLRGRPNDPLDIVVGQGVAKIAGLVRNNKDELVPAATVVLAPKETARRKRPDQYRVLRSDDTGQFRVGNLPPGEYRLFAWTMVEDRAWLNDDFMRPLEGSGVAVTAGVNGSYNVELKIIPEARQ